MIMLIFETTKDQPILELICPSNFMAATQQGRVEWMFGRHPTTPAVLFHFLWRLRRLIKLHELRTISNPLSSVYSPVSSS